MQFEYDPERLIAEVKARPGLWDFDDANYRNKDTRRKLWTQVVKTLLQGNINSDVTVTKSELRELELQLQKKWKSIRDCFFKYINKPNKYKRPYVYSGQLQFLLKEKNLDQSGGGDYSAEIAGVSDSDENRPLKKQWKQRKKMRVEKTEQSSDDNSNSYNDFAPFTDDDGTQGKSDKLSDQFVFASVDTTRNDIDDPDKMFLLSLLPHLKSIPESYRLHIKTEIMQILRNANSSINNI